MSSAQKSKSQKKAKNLIEVAVIENQNLYTAVSRSVVGMMVMFMNLRIGRVNILPTFAAYLILVSAVRYMEQERPDARILKPVGLVLALWHAVVWGLECFAVEITGYFNILRLIFAAGELFFMFRILTDFAAIAEKYQQPGEKLSHRFKTLRIFQIVIQVIMYAVTILPLEGIIKNSTAVAVVSNVGSIAALVVAVLLIISLFMLRTFFRPKAAR